MVRQREKRRERKGRTPSRVPALAAAKPKEVAVDAMSTPMRPYLSTRVFMVEKRVITSSSLHIRRPLPATSTKGQQAEGSERESYANGAPSEQPSTNDVTR